MSHIEQDEKGNFIVGGYVSPFTGECNAHSPSQPQPRKKRIRKSGANYELILELIVQFNKQNERIKMLEAAMVNNNKIIESDFAALNKKIEKK